VLLKLRYLLTSPHALQPRSASDLGNGQQFSLDWFTKTLSSGEIMNRIWLLGTMQQRNYFVFHVCFSAIRM
jgi:hypothetical protein